MKMRITRCGAALLVAPFVIAGLASVAQADHVKKIAVMAPEEGTDFGWNQQGVDGAKMAAAKVGGIEVDGFLILPRPARQRARRKKSRNLAAGS